MALPRRSRQNLRFFSLAMSIVTAPYEKLSNTQRKRWGIDERGFAPAILIAKLGLHHEYHGKGHGSDLIDAALNKCVETAQGAACLLIVVDALKEELVCFYTKEGFIRLNGLRFVLTMRAAQKRLASRTNSRQGE
ncbi:GNAT family N-acetyltransferase [Schaalia sp. Marseille-Q2122]|uniref:GNAT family N-acetyltransferase n=1 Tax=Schaalia sp. Marseille-Q2122 TaxID=2736604 RepID=UPI00158F2866|nr:GNAT family N-acetyltransferase [Schaalia sp. Marseille-Q2122]